METHEMTLLKKSNFNVVIDGINIRFVKSIQNNSGKLLIEIYTPNEPTDEEKEIFNWFYGTCFNQRNVEVQLLGLDGGVKYTTTFKKMMVKKCDFNFYMCNDDAAIINVELCHVSEY